MPLQFEYPLGPKTPVAVYEHLDAFPSEPRPESLSVALPAAMLPIALEWKWTPEYPVVVFTGPFWGVLTESVRNAVWDHWGAPIFEYRLDASWNVVAEECDAHEGLHVRAGMPVPADAIYTRCGCGRTTPRILVEENLFGIAADAAA